MMRWLFLYALYKVNYANSIRFIIKIFKFLLVLSGFCFSFHLHFLNEKKRFLDVLLFDLNILTKENDLF